MSINWQEVITTIGGEGVLLAAAAWLMKAIVSNRLALDAEKFRTELKADADSEIERLRSALQIAAAERQVRFTKLHEKRAEVLEEMNNRLVDLQQEGERFVFIDGFTEEPGQREAYLKTNEKLREFYLFVEKRPIYYRTRLRLIKDVHGGREKDGYWRRRIRFDRASHAADAGRKNRALMAAFHAFEESIPAARRSLENEFRIMLGVEACPRHPG